MKFTKLFFLSAFFVLACCFSVFAVEEHFNVDGDLAAIYEFMESKELEGTVLFIRAYTAEEKRMDKFAEYIRGRCQLQQINLRVIATGNLIYSLDKHFDLKIEVNGRCVDFNIHKWAITALGIGKFMVCNEGPYESERFEERVRMSGGGFTSSKQEPRCLYEAEGIDERARMFGGKRISMREEPRYVCRCWDSRRLRDVIITDHRISAAQYATPHSAGADGWFYFTHQSADFCRNLVIMGIVYPYDTVPRAFRY